MTMNPMLMEALGYAKQGYKVFPCLPKSKAPATPDGFKSATTDPQTIENWWRAWPTANVAIACGEASNLTVIDVDGEEGWASLKELGYDKSQATVLTPTGGGHLYFNYTPSIRNKVKFKPGLDIRTEGGYVLASPSIHPEGGAYEKWGDRRGTFPPNIASLITTPPKPERSIDPSDTDVVEGGRNDYLTKMAGALRRLGLDESAMLAALMEHNETKCSPPLPQREVEMIASSISRYAPEEDALRSLKPDSPLERSGTDLVRIGDLVTSSITYLKDKDKVKGQPTHMEALDKMLGGGKRLGEVTCWHAEAKTGKNTFWHYLMYLWLELGIPIAYASRELTPESEVIPNLLALEFKENAWLSVLDGTEGAKRVENYSAKLRQWPLYFSQGYGFFPLEDIVAWVDNGVAAGISYFWFDHLHYMLDDPEDHKAASKLIKELKTLAKQRNVHIDIIIQPNKLQDGQKLSLNSIKGGAAMGQAIDNLIILERVKDEGVKNVMKLTLEVARSKLCKPGSMYLKFNSEDTSFDEVELEQAPPPPMEPMGGNSGAPYSPMGLSIPRLPVPRIIKPSDAAPQHPNAGVKVFNTQF